MLWKKQNARKNPQKKRVYRNVPNENAHRVLSVETMDSNELCIESVIESKNVSANKLSMAHSFGTHRYKTINVESSKKPLRPLRTEEEEAIEEMPDYRTWVGLVSCPFFCSHIMYDELIIGNVACAIRLLIFCMRCSTWRYLIEISECY